MVSVLRLLILVSLLSLGMAADGFTEWLALPPEKQAAERDARMRQARRSGDAWLATYLGLFDQPPEARLAAAEALLRSTPPARIGWVQLANGQACAALSQNDRAIRVLESARDAGNARLRYECDRVLADVLSALGRRQEAGDLLREAGDLAKRELYADTGVGPARLVSAVAAGPDPAAELYRQAVEARNAGRLDAADQALATIAIRYAGSPWAAPARVFAGWVQMSRDRVDQAERIWSTFVTSDPVGPWRGVAQVCLIDSALEYRVDAAAAGTRANELEALLARHGPVASGTDKPGDGWATIARELSLRRILLALVAGNTADARSRAEALLASGGPDRLARPAGDVIIPAAGIGKLLEQFARGVPLSPAPALVPGREAANLRILLADWWACIDESGRARRILAELRSDNGQAVPVQRIYARMRLADLDYAAWKVDAFRDGYQACLAESARNPWAPHQMLALAVDAYARRKDEKGALERLAALQQSFPASTEACSAGWYRGVIPWWAGRWREAQAAWDDLDRSYPGHPWSDLLASTYRPQLAARIAAGTPAVVPADAVRHPPMPSPAPGH